MRRKSALAVRLLGDVAARGLDLRPRRLKGWTEVRLVKLPGTPYGDQVDHFEALAELAASGRSADTVAIQLAARGFACGRVCEAVRRELGLPVDGTSVDVPVLDLTTDSSGDQGFAELEQMTDEIYSDAGAAALPMVSLLSLVHRRSGRYAANVAEATGVPW